MRVSEYFNLGLTQPELDFVDVDVVDDTRLYLDPRALLDLNSEWADHAIALVQGFFQDVLQAIGQHDANRGRALLSQLREPNETHLGLSRGRSKGRGLGWESATDVYDAMSQSQAAQSGLLEDLEDAVLVIPGIDKDIVSDITTNLIRGPLITFTQETCGYYGIPMQQVDSGPLWNPQRHAWEHGFVDMPVTAGGKLLLVPKEIVRRRMNYDGQEYFNHYVLTYLQQLELSAGSNLVQVLKDGRRRVTKKSLRAKYGSGKPAAARVTQQYPEILEQYRREKRAKIDTPLTHQQLAEATGFEEPDFEALLAKVLAVEPGLAGATAYHRAVEALLSALFYPALTGPHREFEIHDGRKRIDIRYINPAHSGFFYWLGQHYPSSHVWVECKNYQREIGNPELDQLSGRFSPQRGRFGLLLYRGYADKDEVWQRLIDTSHDDRGWIIALDDSDLRLLVDERIHDGVEGNYSVLRELFERLIT
jgi:hypothetical protein